MTDVEDAKYELKAVTALRGMEAKSIARWRNEGWDFVRQQDGVLRTQLLFQRPKPKTPGDHLKIAWAWLRRQKPAVQTGAIGGAVAVLTCAIGGFAILAASDSGSGSGSGGGSIALATPAATGSVPGASQELRTSREAAIEPAAVGSTPDSEAVLTKKNSKRLAAVLRSSDPADERVAAFAADFAGRTISFKGNVADVANFDDYSDKSCDLEVSAGCEFMFNTGEYHENSSTGPNFKFEDVNSIEGLRIVDSDSRIETGQSVRIVAVVDRFDDESQLFWLTPISTELL